MIFPDQLFTTVSSGITPTHGSPACNHPGSYQMLEAHVHESPMPSQNLHFPLQSCTTPTITFPFPIRLEQISETLGLCSLHDVPKFWISISRCTEESFCQRQPPRQGQDSCI